MNGQKMFLGALLKETKAPTKYRKPDMPLQSLVPPTQKYQLSKTQSQYAQHSPYFHIKSDSNTYPSTVLHTGTRNKAWHTARESLTDMLFLFFKQKRN